MRKSASWKFIIPNNWSKAVTQNCGNSNCVSYHGNDLIKNFNELTSSYFHPLTCSTEFLLWILLPVVLLLPQVSLLSTIFSVSIVISWYSFDALVLIGLPIQRHLDRYCKKRNQLNISSWLVNLLYQEN